MFILFCIHDMYLPAFCFRTYVRNLLKISYYYLRRISIVKSNKCSHIYLYDIFAPTIKTHERGKTYGIFEFVRGLGHFLQFLAQRYWNGDSNRSLMLTLRPTASCSIVSSRGIVRPLRMSDIVDRGTPVINDTWRMVIFFLSIICSRSIFIYLVFTKLIFYLPSKYWMPGSLEKIYQNTLS